ncbi:MAG: DUF3592 domain-containing protein [Planctomycetaceae bacterium]
MSAVETNSDASELDDLDFIYELKKPVGLRPVFYIVGGVALLGVAAVAFLLGLLLPAEKQPFALFIASTVIPTLGAFAAFGVAIGLMRSPRRVTVGSTELVVEGNDGVRRWTWNEIGWATIGMGALSYQRQLTIFDVRGKKLVTLGTAFDDFDGLAESIKATIDRKPDNVAAQVQSRKAKKTGASMILGGVAFLALAIANGVNARLEQSDAERLTSDGKTIDATIKRHYLYNITPRLEYEFTTPDGKTVTRDAMLRQDAWNSLDGATTVPVRYVPDDPDNNRLVAGEVANETGSPVTNLLLSVAVGMLSLFFLTVGVLQYRGWDVDLDSKTGKVSIQRFGAGR